MGPLVVTAVLARVTSDGSRFLSRKLPKRLRADLDDSKRLVAHGDVALGEAWARAIAGEPVTTPEALLDRILLEGRDELSRPCPENTRAQCWGTKGEEFSADAELCARIAGHLSTLRGRGVTILGVRSAVVCTKRLNELREHGINRFVADLHAMERLVLELRTHAGVNVHATCGKVGGMGEYGKFFGPLSGHLHAVIEEGSKKSSYYVPNVGELSFVRDADARDPLVMLASLVGKYLRELLMGRIARFYPSLEGELGPSGYHDPVSHAFVERTALVRRERQIPMTCFERSGELLASKGRS